MSHYFHIILNDNTMNGANFQNKVSKVQLPSLSLNRLLPIQVGFSLLQPGANPKQENCFHHSSLPLRIRGQCNRWQWVPFQAKESSPTNDTWYVTFLPGTLGEMVLCVHFQPRRGLSRVFLT